MFLNHKLTTVIHSTTWRSFPALLFFLATAIAMTSCASVSKHPIEPPQEAIIESGSVVWLVKDTARTRNLGSQYYATFSTQRRPNASEVFTLKDDESCKIVEERTIHYLIGTEEGEKLYLITFDNRPEFGVVAAMQMIVMKTNSKD